MSKSKLNGVDPQDIIDRYGADAARLFVMFASPPDQTIEWSDAGVDGAFRFLRRVWALGQKLAALPAGEGDGAATKSLRREIHLTLKQANYDYQRFQYNTVVSACMKMLNAIEAASANASPIAAKECFGILLRVLYPVSPHITVELWDGLGFATAHGSLLDASWPDVDEAALVQDEIELVLQVNGKLRGHLRVPAAASKGDIEAAAIAHEAVQKATNGQAAKKIVVVPGRLVNVVA